MIEAMRVGNYLRPYTIRSLLTLTGDSLAHVPFPCYVHGLSQKSSEL